ncbi:MULTISPECIES: hypothetical protein [Lactobacillus]|uniref:Uncharacterized protein n=1 Tax=Lactobacillus melliventris TaxID=1218507 RepID=A0A0F4L8T8_9LACO|nr:MULTISPECIES: hypothetical protein [Lactobacillus]KJY54708.1 hypothetical protein JF74_18830 [Lactobacillus melliventris]UZX32486.1 hypothetical protein LDX52_09365 [Lactobacillus helsingborgensis]
MTTDVKNIKSDSQEIIAGDRNLDRWIVYLSDFLQTEKSQLIALHKLQNDKNDGKTKWQLSDTGIDVAKEKKIDDIIYELFRSSISLEQLKQHGLSFKRQDFDALLYMPPDNLMLLEYMDDNYLKCCSFEV